ncbi:hypothetical protein Goarm_004665 [Gossypium armourianum]|uniref:Uncharacterized protein n=1 Tax=Gossypium armourianum TaxID=34283 RepID=A0A7J9JXI2_9ROSI|nr:hypothetical protein [Gossypium armourianum]
MEGPELKKRKIHKPPPRRSVSCTLSRAQMRSRSLKSASVGVICIIKILHNTDTSPVSLHVVSPLAEVITNSVSPFGLFSEYGRQNPDTETISSVEGVRHSKVDTRTVASPASKTLKDAKPTSSSRITGVQTSDINSFRIQQDKNFAVAQAQQDGCTGNFMKFDSWYGNFLVPVVPSRAEFNR